MGSRQEFLTRVKDMADVRLDFVEHELVCPLCQKRTRHASAGATIPLATRDAVESRKLKKGDIVLFAAVGAGFTAGVNLWRWAY